MTAPAFPEDRVALVGRLRSFGDAVALRWVGRCGLESLTYAGLSARVDERRMALGSTPRLVLLEAANDVESVVTLLAALAGGHPVLLCAPARPLTRAEAHEAGSEAAWWEAWDPDVVAQGADLTQRREGSAHDLHPDLALLMSTSGSTGSPKLVRLSAANLDCNSAQIVEALDITSDDVAATTLPLQYCYGLSVLLSHLSVGAGVLLTDLSVVDTCFWDAFADGGGTTLAGVPYTFDLLDAAGFATRDLSTLRLITQAGGRLEPSAVRRWVELGQERGFDFVVMYGQTEATARMATLPAHLALENPTSIGVAVSGGHFSLAPVEGAEAGVGELVFEGGNVMMGYASTSTDLARGPEVEALHTGDLARFTADGLVEIVGRRSRFAKVCGLRMDLDRIESDLSGGGHTAYAMDGGDRLLLAVSGAHAGDLASVRREVSERYAVPRAAVVVAEIGDVPRTLAGKVDRPALAVLVDAFGEGTCPTPDRLMATSPSAQSSEQVRALFAELLRRPDACADDSFVSLRGDSLSYVEASVRLEGLLGSLPESWHTRSIRELGAWEGPRSLAPRPQGLWSRGRGDGRDAGTSAGWRRGLRSLETSVLLRALAIVVVVFSHAGVIELRGGAHVLLAVAGFSFARFQLSHRTRSQRVAHIVESVTRIALPSAVWLLVLTLVDVRYSWWNPLLLTSIGGGNVHPQWRYWFVEALVHLLVGMAILLSVPAFDRLERARPFLVPAVLAVVALLFRYGVIDVGTHHVNGRPAMVLWLFALGWAMARAQVGWQRWLLTAYVVVVVPGFFSDPVREATVMLGLLILLWVRSVRVPAVVVPVVAALASASLFIYLVHWEVMGRVGWSPLGACVALLTGWIAWRGASPLIELAARAVSSLLSRPSTVATGADR